MDGLVRAVVYVRVSTDKQEDSPDRQNSTTLPYIERKRGQGYRLVAPADTYVDLNQKGHVDDRPAFQRLLADAKAGKFDTVVVDQGSRLSRHKPSEFFRSVAGPLEDAHVQIESVQKGKALNFDEIGDWITQSVEQFQNNSESSNTSWRVLSNVIMRAQKGGVYLGSIPYGYKKKERENAPPTLEFGDEAEVRVVRFIFEAYGDMAMSTMDIAEELTRRGVATPYGRAAWRSSTVLKMLHNVAYVGIYRFNEKNSGGFYRRTKDGIVPNQKGRKRGYKKNPESDWIVIPEYHPPLVGRELFYRCQDLITRNRRNTAPGRNRRDFVLAGLLVCTNCGCRMTGWVCKWSNRNGQFQRNTYRCASGYEAGKCKLNVIDEDEIVKKAVETIEQYTSPERLQQIRTRLATVIRKRFKPAAGNALAEERARLQKQITNAKSTLAFLETDEDRQEVSAKLKAWRGRLQEIESQLGVDEPKAVAVMHDLLKEIETCRWELLDAWKKSDRRHLRALLLRVVRQIEVCIEAVPWRKNRSKYVLVGGKVHLNPSSPLAAEAPGGKLILASSMSDTGGPTTVRHGTWGCELSLA